MKGAKYIPSLLILAAVCLLPGWLVGGAALGLAALYALLLAGAKLERKREQRARKQAVAREVERTRRAQERAQRLEKMRRAGVISLTSPEAQAARYRLGRGPLPLSKRASGKDR